MPSCLTRLGLVLLLVAAGLPRGSAQAAPPETPPHAATASVEHAVAVLVPIGGSGVQGVIHFDRHGKELLITGKISGLKPGKHGFHVHEFGDLTDTHKGESAGGHFNPQGAPHGRPSDPKRHVGDFGNLEANPQGVAVVHLTDTVATLDGPHAILGRALVVHAGEDKFTQPVGDAGARVAFGIIGVAAPTAAPAK